MPNNSELKIDLYEDSPQNRKERLINRRLIPVYNMAVDSILHYRNGPAQNLLDIGVFDGRFIHHLAKAANKIYGIDYKQSMVEQAWRHSLNQKLVQNGQLDLRQMDALQMSFLDLPPEPFDAITCIEVIGAGLKGKKGQTPTDATKEIINQSFDLLQPGGVFTFTMKDAEYLEYFNYTGFEFEIPKGTPIVKNDLLETVNNFSQFEWYGQICLQATNGVIGFPGDIIYRNNRPYPQLNRDIYQLVPESQINDQQLMPLCWTGVGIK
jgi:SAM-dependent methyltransferase